MSKKNLSIEPQSLFHLSDMIPSLSSEGNYVKPHWASLAPTHQLLPPLRLQPSLAPPPPGVDEALSNIHLYNTSFLETDEHQTNSFYERIVESVSEPLAKLYETIEGKNLPQKEIAILEQYMKSLEENRKYARKILIQKLSFLRRAKAAFASLPPASKRAGSLMLEIGANLAEYNKKWEQANVEVMELAAPLSENLNRLLDEYPEHVTTTLMLEAELMEFFDGNSAAKRKLEPFLKHQPLKLKLGFRLSSISLQLLAAEELFHINALNHCVSHDCTIALSKGSSKADLSQIEFKPGEDPTVEATRRSWNLVASLARGKSEELTLMSEELKNAAARINESTSKDDLLAIYLKLKKIVGKTTQNIAESDHKMSDALSHIFKVERESSPKFQEKIKTILSAATVFAPIPRGVPSFINFIEFDVQAASAFAQATTPLLRHWSFYMQTAAAVNNLHSTLEMSFGLLTAAAATKLITYFEKFAVEILNQRICIENYLLDLWSLRQEQSVPLSPEFLQLLESRCNEELEKVLARQHKKIKENALLFVDEADSLSTGNLIDTTAGQAASRLKDMGEEVLASLERTRQDFAKLEKTKKEKSKRGTRH
eukprot:GHVP01056934.1.p1 GENE.GHVP01056934.1~~GHVP01056934.1.p1  ORF type:complete len:598 (+),score=122.73 GHVP01056934.1:337-2130(+)